MMDKLKNVPKYKKRYNKSYPIQKMQSIRIKNFKSYQSQTIAGLNNRINVILGANGQGKSNFFKAISFLFTDRFTINRNEFNATLYRGERSQQPEIQVQANFSQKQGEGYEICKKWSDSTKEDMKVNGSSINRAEFEDFVESFGLSYTNPYNIVQQGKVSQITQMSENELYLLLEQIAGIKKFMKKYEEAESNLNKVEGEMREVEGELAFLKDKVSIVENKKNEYEFYAVEEKARRIKKKRELGNFIVGVEKRLEEVRKRHHEAVKEAEEARVKEKDLQWELEQKERALRTLQEKVRFYEKQNSEDVETISFFGKKPLSAKKKQLKEFERKIANQQNALEQNEKKLEGLQKQLRGYREKYETIKVDFQANGESKDSKKVKEAYELKIKSEKQAIKTFEEEMKKLESLKKQFRPINYSKEQQELSDLRLQFTALEEEFRHHRMKQIETGRLKMNLECQSSTLLNKKKTLDEFIKKILPFVDFRLLAWLKENRVEGVHGYLLEHVRIDENVAFAYELSGMQKLGMLLVEDDQVAAKVIEINKKIQGKNVSIMPLNFVKTQVLEKRSYPKMENVYPLINEQWMSIADSPQLKQETKLLIQKILNNTFAKYMLVQDYATALKVSKEYNLNCITADRQIVYADAYMCKVGRQETYEKGKIEMFANWKRVTKEIQALKQEIKQVERKQVEMQNREVELGNQKEKLQLRMNQLNKSVEEGKKIEDVLKKLDSKKAAVSQSIQKSNRTIFQYEQALKNIQSNVKSKFSQADLQKAESQYFALRSRAQSLSNSNYEQQKSLSNMIKEIEVLKKQMSGLEKKSDFELQSKDEILAKIKKERQNTEKQISGMTKELVKATEKQQQLREREISILAELNVQEENHKDIIKKIEGLGDVSEQEEDQINELSNSLSRKINSDSMMSRKRQFYTARDKVFFTKITEYIDKIHLYVDSTKMIQQQKEKFIQFMERTEQGAKDYMKSFIIDFEKHFIRYFLRVVPGGKAELKTKIFSQKIKGLTKNGHSLEIKVSFNEEEGIRKWNEFSGGQKTVLALCIILAVQKCSPTPFCVLDEVDAALDPFYVEKLVEVIIEESEFCQYFITSFKKQMLDFPENIASYFLVKNVDNRISTLTQVDKHEAQQVIDEVAQ